MTKYIVRWLDQEKPIEVEAMDYRIFPSSYERQDVTFYDHNKNPIMSVMNVNRLEIKVKE